MLNPATPFPQVGSFALYQDPELPPAQRQAELARILRVDSSGLVGEAGPDNKSALIALPLRLGAGGTKTVALADLIDATELDQAEARELADKERYLFDRSLRTPRQRAMQARVAALKHRALWAPCLARQLKRYAALQAARSAA